MSWVVLRIGQDRSEMFHVEHFRFVYILRFVKLWHVWFVVGHILKSCMQRWEILFL